MSLLEWERRRKLSGERGLFYPVTDSAGTVKFGPDRGITARAAVEVTYRDEEPIDNLLWEVADDQEVSFDRTTTRRLQPWCESGRGRRSRV
ncbi:hypothetical protein HPB48_015719 [Haemaphysalis longicornis]|uniref:Uncharacterized protein n=1 Tax=Haemaphysalis longicornis TaxID=44386 RepID=A0A9J6GIW6_HAELO|nr:hypothetical protein HPB48_015719 [Haemaphysalis longicornis]